MGTPAKTPLLSDDNENSDAPTPVVKKSQLEKNKKKNVSSANNNNVLSANKNDVKNVKATTSTDTLEMDMSMSNEEYAVGNNNDSVRVSALDVDAGDFSEGNNNNEKEKKKGDKFFLFCCDCKRAGIMLNSFLLMLNLFTFTAIMVQANPEAEGYVRAVTVPLCGMFVTFTTLLGFYYYSKSIILVGLTYCCYNLTMGIIALTKYDWQGLTQNEDGKLSVLFPVVMNVLIFYAEAVFVCEVNDGIMTPETYKRREKYSCCCNC